MHSALRSLDQETVHRLLTDVRDDHLPLKKLNETCRTIKKMAVIKKVFLRLIDEKEAEMKYPHHAVDAQLASFISLPVTEKGPVHSALQSYCQKALRSTIQGATQTPSDSIVLQ